MNKLTLALSGAACAAMLSACTMTAEQCDPSADPGFLNKIGCTVSGSYGERVEQKEQKLQALNAENEHLYKLHQQIADEDALINGSIEERAKQLKAMQNELAALRSDLQSKGQLSSSLKQQLDDTNKQIELMQNTPPNAAVLEKMQQVEDLEAYLEQLQS